MKYRPENWKTPYRFLPTPSLLELTQAEQTDVVRFLENEAFEAGADAILGALLDGDNTIGASEDIITYPGFMVDIDDHIRSLGNGYWVFIPDEDNNE